MKEDKIKIPIIGEVKDGKIKYNKKNICPVCGKPYIYRLETNYNYYTGKRTCKHDEKN